MTVGTLILYPPNCEEQHQGTSPFGEVVFQYPPVQLQPVMVASEMIIQQSVGVHGATFVFLKIHQ